MLTPHDTDNPYIPGFEEYIRQGELTDEMEALMEKLYREKRPPVYSDYEIIPRNKSKKKSPCTMEEIAVLRTVRLHPELTLKQIAEEIGKPEEATKRITENLVARGQLRHEKGQEEGDWEIVYDYLV